MLRTENGRAFPAKLYLPGDTPDEFRGAGTMHETSTRIVRTIFDYRNAPYANLVLGEVIDFPGKWSSYPPHHHPQPEIYYYKNNPGNGAERFVPQTNRHPRCLRAGDRVRVLLGLRHPAHVRSGARLGSGGRPRNPGGGQLSREVQDAVGAWLPHRGGTGRYACPRLLSAGKARLFAGRQSVPAAARLAQLRAAEAALGALIGTLKTDPPLTEAAEARTAGDDVSLVETADGFLMENGILRVRVDGDAIILETVKPADTPAGTDDIILRLYESLRTQASGVLHLPFDAQVYESSMDEGTVGVLLGTGRDIPLRLKPFEILTLRVVRRAQAP